MEYVALVLAIVAGVAAVVAAAQIATVRILNKEVADLKKQLDTMNEDKKKASLVYDDEVRRREAVITDLKSELTEMEKSLAENKDPAAVRARLGKLLRP